MPREESRDKRAPPCRARHSQKKPKNQQRVNCVEKNAGQVMSTRVESKQLDIQRVRNPGERMPVAGVAGRERPGGTMPVQSILDSRVAEDVGPVVVIDEAVMGCR